MDALLSIIGWIIGICLIVGLLSLVFSILVNGVFTLAMLFVPIWAWIEGKMKKNQEHNEQ